MSSFHDFKLLPTLVSSLKNQGLTQPTEIQSSALPELLEGSSFVGVAETGSGKTLAYALPVLHRLKSLELDSDPVKKASHPRGLVVVPSRELGEQVSKVFKGLTHATRLRVRTALGGSQKQISRQNVSGQFEILIATPGRLEQLLEGGELRLTDVRTLVLDEADELLDSGFLPATTRIVRACPENSQLVMFSATLPQSASDSLQTIFGEVPKVVRTRGSQQLVATLRTDNRQVINGRRFDTLKAVLTQEPDLGTLLFANTRKQCEAIASWLAGEGYEHVTYMGEMDRLERRRNLARFRTGEVALLIATDLGGRGLDIDRVDRVINVHLPTNPNNYLHRVGRTARAGREGLVVNLVTARDQPLFEQLKLRSKKSN